MITKGKWEIGSYDIFTEDFNGVRTNICVMSREDARDKEVLANARLIAAAPELLEACKKMLEANLAARNLSLKDGALPRGTAWGIVRSWLDAAKLNARQAIAECEV